MPSPLQSEPLSLIERRFRTLGSHSPLFYDTPLELVSGKGVWLRAADGRRYLDAYNNVPHVGHSHPVVANAVSKQMRKLSLHTRYLNDRVIDYAEALIALHHPSLDRVSFSNSGSEANEFAIRVARFATGNTGLLMSDHNYHGTTLTLSQAASALQVSEQRGENVRLVRIPDATGLSKAAARTLRTEALAEVDRAITELQNAGYGVAATLFDALFTAEGLVNPPEGFVTGLVERVHRAGGLYIADEVQSGFGRIGSHRWGYERHGAVPDIVTMGKPIGNGHPLAAAVLRADLLEPFGAANQHFNTFGGNPVSAAAGHAVVNVMAEEGLQHRAAENGEFLKRELAAVISESSRISEVRGDGLFLGLRLTHPETGEPDPAAAKRVVEDVLRQGALISRAGRNDEVLKIRPPLAFQAADAEILLGMIARSIRAL